MSKQSLVERYKPEMISDFAGLTKTKAILKALARSPYDSAWAFLGPSGIGKTTMALALCNGIGGMLHHIPSRNCNLETVESVVHDCWYKPLFGGDWHVVLIDEADQMTKAAQLAFLSKLDTTAKPPNTIFVFTMNDTKGLEDRFLSRMRTLHFAAPTVEESVEWLEGIWRKETTAAVPDCKAIFAESQGNLRQALMELELELLTVEVSKPKVNTVTDRFGRTMFVPAMA